MYIYKLEPLLSLIKDVINRSKMTYFKTIKFAKESANLQNNYLNHI